MRIGRNRLRCYLHIVVLRSNAEVLHHFVLIGHLFVVGLLDLDEETLSSLLIASEEVVEDTTTNHQGSCNGHAGRETRNGEGRHFMKQLIRLL